MKTCQNLPKVEEMCKNVVTSITIENVSNHTMISNVPNGFKSLTYELFQNVQQT